MLEVVKMQITRKKKYSNHKLQHSNKWLLEDSSRYHMFNLPHNMGWLNDVALYIFCHNGFYEPCVCDLDYVSEQ